MSNLCPQCKARFAPYQTKNGTCPVCRTGTVRVAADPTVTQDAFKAITMAEELERHVVDQYEAFEQYCRERDWMKPQTIAQRLVLEQWFALESSPGAFPLGEMS